MLTQARVTTILPAILMDRARRFYRDTLGLGEEGQSGDGKYLYASGGGGILALMEKPGGTKADHTAISFEVNNVETMVERLTELGVKFEDYDYPGLKTVNKVCVLGSEKAAWFRDPEGNILCIHEPIGERGV